MSRNTPLRELLLRSDFGRVDPARVQELLDAVIEDRTGGMVLPDPREDEERELEAA